MEVVSCLGSIVQSCCGEGGALQTNVFSLCGEHSQCSGHTGFAPAHGCVLSPSTLLRLLAALYGAGPCVACSSSFGVLHKSADSVGPAFCAFPARAAQSARRLMSALSPLQAQPQFLPVPVGCAWCLFWGADLWLRPSQQMSTIQNLRKPLVRNWKPVW